jgi:hypothetical protein
MSRRLGGWLSAAGMLAVLALGLPWSPDLLGAAAPARVAVAAAVGLVVAGLARRADRLLTLAVPVGAAGVLLGGLTPSSGRLALAAAVVCLAAGLRADGRRILPGR